MKKKISIITVNLNNSVGLEKTIITVLSQKYKIFEFIVIDGDSTDNSVKIIKKYNEQISFWVSEKDNGIFHAMNKGIKVAKGEYLLFLNSGDVFNGESALLDFLNHKNFSGDIIYGDYKFLNGEKIYPDLLTPLHFFKSSLPHQSSFIKRSLFENFGLYDETFKIVSDKAFFLKCFLSNKVEFKHINYALSIADLNGISNNIDNREKVFLENNKILKEQFGVFYIDYKNMLILKDENKNIKRHTIEGIIIRIKNKFKSLFV